jgi:Ion channel
MQHPKRASLLFTHTENQAQYETFHEMMDLPYDFTIRDCIVALLVYLCISILAYSFIFERWSIIDSMYFACVSFTTIGYGDLSPTTTGGRFFCIFFALAGVAILAIALGVLGSHIIENEVAAMEQTKHKIVDEILARLPILQEKKPNPKVLLHSSSSGDNDNGKGGVSHNNNSHTSSSFDYLRDFDDPNIHDDYDDISSTSKWKQTQEFCTLLSQLLCRYVPSLLPLFIGSLIIGHSEGWSIIDSIYYCVVTTTTIGYGDRVPQHEGMKLFAIVFIPLSVGAMGHFLGTVANFIIEQRRKAYDKQLWKHELTIQDLYCMSSTGVVTELDFVIFMLQAMKKVDKELIDHIRNHFHVLDVTNSNTLCRDDLELIARKKLRTVKTKLRMNAYRQSLKKSISAVSSS